MAALVEELEEEEPTTSPMAASRTSIIHHNSLKRQLKAGAPCRLDLF
jgi:hypothetical protein